MSLVVKSLYVGGLKKVFKSGDVVCEDDFDRGEIKALLKEGFLEEKPDEIIEEKNIQTSKKK